MRRDLADVRLAERVFAPHYAAPLPLLLTRAADLRAGPREDAELLARLAPGELFEVLEFRSETSWGVAPGHGLVGYVATNALGEGSRS